MTVWAIIVITLFAAPLSVRLAPDQPAAIVYMDEPLIIEVVAEEDGAAAFELEIQSAQGVELREELETAPLTAGHPRWIEVNDLPLRRGPYTAEVSWRLNASEGVWRQTFCRIDRPGPARQAPWAVAVEALDPPTHALLMGIPASEVWLPATAPDFESQAQAAADNGLRIVAAVNFSGGSDGEAGPPVPMALRGVDGWALHAAEAPDHAATLAASLHGAGARIPVTFVVETPADLETLLAAGLGQCMGDIAVPHGPDTAADFARYRAVSTSFGYEQLGFLLDLRGHEAAALAEPEVVYRALLEAWGVNRARPVISSGALWSEGAVYPFYAYLNAMSALLTGANYVGERVLSGGARALVFRKGDSWTIAAWSAAGGAEPELTIEGEYSPLVYDAFHNLIAPPLAEDGFFRFSLGARPLYLVGSGGTILREAAAWSVTLECSRLLEDKAVMENIPSPVAAVISALVRGDAPDKDRERFFTLLRAIPGLEQEGHEGTLPLSVAVRAIAGISRVAWAMGALDQEEGEVFIDPLVDTLGRCSDFQSDYITGLAAGASNERGDILLQIINRLVEEAKALSAEGRPIESQAVGAIAEWRARSLAAAAKAAPLSRSPIRPIQTGDQNGESKGKKQ